MIVSGNLPKHVLTQEAPQLACHSCGEIGAIDFHVISNCVHLFFIPLCPINKTGYSTCRNCGSQLREAEMPAEMKSHFRATKSTASTPWWQFFGIVTLGLLLLLLPVITRVVNSFSGMAEEPLPIEYEETFPDDNPRDGSDKKDDWDDEAEYDLDYAD